MMNVFITLAIHKFVVLVLFYGAFNFEIVILNHLFLNHVIFRLQINY